MKLSYARDRQPSPATRLVRLVTATTAADAGDAKAQTLGEVAAQTAGQLGVGADGTLLLGVGAASAKTCLTAGRKFALALSASEERELLVDASALGGDEDALRAFVRGLSLGAYVLGQWRQARPEPATDGYSVVVAGDLPDATGERVLAQAAQLAEGQRAAMHLVDRPANAKRPADVAAYARELGRECGFDVEVLDEEALEIQGFGGHLAVGRASAHPPRLVKLSYDGPGAGASTFELALVGKGITFDTGGVSIKPSQNLAAMKSDLGGAAAVLGTFVAAARLGLPVRLRGLLACAENAVGGDAYLPSDVIRNYSGKTIEIVDTDAEGRLVLADALAYLPDWASPSLTIDLATLTGSAVRTFGYECAAAFAHDPDLISRLSAAGERHGERLWPLPLWDEYEADLKSDVADVKHFHGKPIAGAINAAKFLEYFVADRQRWVHLDIAPVAFGNNDFARDRSASGYGVALLTQFILDTTRSGAEA